MTKIIFAFSLTMLVLAGTWFFYKEADTSAKWKSVKIILYTLFFGLISISILSAITILF